MLLRLDPGSVDLSKPGVHQRFYGWPLAWTRSYGQGRVFYTALGHEASVWQDARYNAFANDEVVISTSSDGGATWSQPALVNTHTGQAAFNPSVYVTRTGAANRPNGLSSVENLNASIIRPRVVSAAAREPAPSRYRPRDGIAPTDARRAHACARRS